jgi:hypothetical protein
VIAANEARDECNDVIRFAAPTLRMDECRWCKQEAEDDPCRLMIPPPIGGGGATILDDVESTLRQDAGEWGGERSIVGLIRFPHVAMICTK